MVCAVSSSSSSSISVDSTQIRDDRQVKFTCNERRNSVSNLHLHGPGSAEKDVVRRKALERGEFSFRKGPFARPVDVCLASTTRDAATELDIRVERTDVLFDASAKDMVGHAGADRAGGLADGDKVY